MRQWAEPELKLKAYFFRKNKVAILPPNLRKKTVNIWKLFPWQYQHMRNNKPVNRNITTDRKWFFFINVNVFTCKIPIIVTYHFLSWELLANFTLPSITSILATSGLQSKSSDLGVFFSEIVWLHSCIRERSSMFEST